MIFNPYLLWPGAANAWAEGFTKGFASISSPAPSENVAPENWQAFNEGVAAGADAAANGVSLNGNACVPALEEHGPLHPAGAAINAAEIAHGVWEAAQVGKLAAGLSSVFVALFELACTLPEHVLPPEDVLPDIGQQMADNLAALGIDSMALFCGAGLDAGAPGCEILLSPLFTSLDRARQAAIDMNRYEWVVASWRTDQSGSFHIVDSGTRE